MCTDLLASFPPPQTKKHHHHHDAHPATQTPTGAPSSAAAARHSNDDQQDGAPHYQHLKRQLTFAQLCMLGVGGSIGAGVFSLTGVAASAAGPAVIFSFIFAGIIAAIDALCYSEMASRYPQAGAVFLWLHLTFGELPALLVSMNLLVDYTVAAALISRSFAVYLVEFLKYTGIGAVPSWVATVPVTEVISFSFIAPLLLLLLTLVLCRGTETGAVLNIILTSIKVGIILLVCLVGMFHVQPRNWSPFFPLGVESVFRTSSTVFFSYVGFDTIASSSEECKDPLRDLPRAIMTSLGVCVAIYCAVCLVLTGMIPYDKIDLAAPLSSAFAGLGLGWVQTLISLGGVVGLATTLLIGLFAQSRIYLGIARDGLLPAFLANIHPVFQTPLNAQVLCGLLPMVLSAFFNVRLLAELLDIGVILAYGTVCASVLVQRSTDRAHTTRWLGVLVAASSVPFTLLKYKATDSWVANAAAFLLPLAALAPLLRVADYPSPAAGVCFACPAVPFVPLAGVVLNVYLAVNLTLAAWLRLLVLWTLLLGYYVWTEHRWYVHGGTGKREAGRGGGRRRRKGDCGGAGGAVVSTSSPSDSMRRRRAQGRTRSTSPLRRPLLVGEDVV